MTARASITAGAFTLVELMVVTVVIGILAISVIPASATIRDARRAAAVNEVERMLVQARARAMATGQPAAIEISVSQGTIRTLALSATGTVVSATGPTGTAQPAIVLESLFPGAGFIAIVNPAGGSFPPTIWFGHDGAPQNRDAAGVLMGQATSDASITLSGGGVVVVRRISGLVER